MEEANNSILEGHDRVVLRPGEDSPSLVPRITCEEASCLWERFQADGSLPDNDALRLLAHVGNPEEEHGGACVSNRQEVHEKVGAFFWDQTT